MSLHPGPCCPDCVHTRWAMEAEGQAWDRASCCCYEPPYKKQQWEAIQHERLIGRFKELLERRLPDSIPLQVINDLAEELAGLKEE